MTRSILAFTASVFALAANALSLSAAYAPKVGTRHPEFTLPNIDGGKPVSLADFRGKRVLLIQFASW